MKKSVKAWVALESLNASKLKNCHNSLAGHKGVVKTSTLGFWPSKKGALPNIEFLHSSSQISQKESLSDSINPVSSKNCESRGTIDATVFSLEESRKDVDLLPTIKVTAQLERQRTQLLTRTRSLEAIYSSDTSTKYQPKDHIIIMPPFDNDRRAPNSSQLPKGATIQLPDILIDSGGNPFSSYDHHDSVHGPSSALSPNTSHFSNININSTKNHRRENKKYVETLGRQLFNHICQKNQKEITIQNFRIFFQSDEDALEAFRIFDRGGNGTVSREEFEFSLKVIYKEKRDISLSMNDLTQAIGNLNKILTVFSAILCAMLSFPLFGISLNSLLPFTSVLLAMSFVFGDYARLTFECIIFLFVIHPYDTGDRIFFDDGSNFIVEELNILTTTLGIDGRKYYVPNRKPKTNFRCDVN